MTGNTGCSTSSRGELAVDLDSKSSIQKLRYYFTKHPYMQLNPFLNLTPMKLSDTEFKEILGDKYTRALAGFSVDDTFADPLELREDSRLGVAGLLETARRGNVVIANPWGSGVSYP